MENQQNNQYNNCIIYNAPVYNTTNTTNNYYPQPVPSSVSPEFDSEDSSSATSDIRPEISLFPRITKAAHDKGIAQQIENELRSASVSAPKLVKCIKTNEALGYLDTQNLASTDLYNLLNDHFQLPFKLRTFQIYRCK